MIPFEATLNGVKVKRELPTSYAEVKFRDFVAIAKSPKDTNSILSVLTGIDKETVKKAKITNVDEVIMAMALFNHDVELKVPDMILGYTVPKDLGFECTAQFEDLELCLKESKEKKLTDIQVMEQYPLYCGIYACSQKYGEYDYQKATYMIEEFMDAPATEVLAIGNFTLLKLIGLRLGIKKGAPKEVTRMQRWRLVLKSWVNSLVLPARLYIWKRRHLTKKMNS